MANGGERHGGERLGGQRLGGVGFADQLHGGHLVNRHEFVRQRNLSEHAHDPAPAVAARQTSQKRAKGSPALVVRPPCQQPQLFLRGTSLRMNRPPDQTKDKDIKKAKTKKKKCVWWATFIILIAVVNAKQPDCNRHQSKEAAPNERKPRKQSLLRHSYKR